MVSLIKMVPTKLVYVGIFSLVIVASFFVGEYTHDLRLQEQRSALSIDSLAVNQEIAHLLLKAVIPGALMVSFNLFNVSLEMFSIMSEPYASRNDIDLLIYSPLVSPTGFTRQDFEAESSSVHGYEVVLTTLVDGELTRMEPNVSHEMSWPIHYRYPANSDLIGYDMFTSTPIRTGIESMLNTKQPDVSDPIHFIDTDELGLVVLQPVYDKSDNSTVTGVIVRGIRSSSIFSSSAIQSFTSSHPSFEIEVFLSRKGGTPSIFYDPKSSDNSLNQSVAGCTHTEYTVDVDIYTCISGSLSLRRSNSYLLVLTLGVLVAVSLSACFRCTVDAAKESEFRSRFIADMSHEIRTPMNGIMGSAELLRDQNLNPICTEYVRMIFSCCTCLLTIIDDVLDMSKIQANKLVIVEAPVKIHTTFHDSVNATWVGYSRSPHFNPNVSLVLEISTRSVLTKVEGDPARIRQVVCNLVSNALKFTDEGHVKVTVDVDDGPSIGQVYINVSVVDTGIGMSEKAMKRLFQPFSQVHQQGRDVGGTGLGLVITNKLVSMMGGKLSCHSRPKEGTTFTFSILTKGKIGPPSPGEISAYTFGDVEAGILNVERTIHMASFSAESFALSSFDVEKKQELVQPNVLVVDDNMVNRLVASNLLESFGCAVETADNGVQAVQACESSLFSVIFMDMIMPVMDGVDATREIRSSKGKNKDTRIVFLTATVSTEATKECGKAGGNDFLTKPVSKHLLYDKLCDNLGQEEVVFVKRHVHLAAEKRVKHT